MSDLISLEHDVQGVYDQRLLPLAKKLKVEPPRVPKASAGLPSVLFLGNHSSGKSSFINHLIDDQIQKTGLAPTDDGFTIITYGETSDQFDGPTVASHPDLNLGFLERLGPDFVSRLRLKTHPNELLKTLNLIDSPGMIDAAHKVSSRGYDYAKSVRYFAEQADLILFFFDPDKPGTTGETVDIFTNQLSGLEHKLLIVMNKVDLFSNIRDFARTYGTLCWNLSKAIKSKDVPHIFNTYLPGFDNGNREDPSGAVSLVDFDQHREEVISEIKRSPTRRADNLVSDLKHNALRLDMHARVCMKISQSLVSKQRKFNALAIVLLIVGAALGYWFFRADNMNAVMITAASAVVPAVLSVVIGKILVSKDASKFREPAVLDEMFAKTFRDDLQRSDRSDLRNLWELTRKQVLDTIEIVGAKKLPRPPALRKMLRQLDKALTDEIPKLRRDLGDHYAQLRKQGGKKG